MPSKTLRRARAAIHRLNLSHHAQHMLAEAEKWAGEQREDAARGLTKWQENSRAMQSWCARNANGDTYLTPPELNWKL